MKDSEILEEFESFCTRAAIKKTAQRFAVFKAVRENYTHPTVEKVFENVKKQIPTIKLECVYRILNDFQNDGLLKKLYLSSAMRFDFNTTEHAHFVCLKCGKIFDIPCPQIELPAKFNKAEALNILVNGVCPDCLKNKKSGLKKSPSAKQ